MSATAAALSAWLTEQEAADRIGCTPRTVRRMVQEGRGPEVARRRVPGRKPERVYHPADVDRIASRLAPVNALVAVPATVPAAAVTMTPSPTPVTAEHLAALAGHLIELVRPAPPAPVRPWMTLDEAAAYIGLSRAFLARLVREGGIPSVRDRAIKVPRAALDAFDPGKSDTAGRKGRGKRPDRPKGSR
jgi:excisionase family DNA binding protein